MRTNEWLEVSFVVEEGLNRSTDGRRQDVRRTSFPEILLFFIDRDLDPFNTTDGGEPDTESVVIHGPPRPTRVPIHHPSEGVVLIRSRSRASVWKSFCDFLTSQTFSYWSYHFSDFWNGILFTNVFDQYNPDLVLWASSYPRVYKLPNSVFGSGTLTPVTSYSDFPSITEYTYYPRISTFL